MQYSETSLIEHKSSCAFSEIFWRKIKEDMRMDVLVEKAPKQKLKLYEIAEEDLNIDLNAVRGWSEDNHNIYFALKENGFADFICNKESLVQNYTQLMFDKERITQMDPLLQKFEKLTLLRLNKNRITFVENVPPNLKELHLYSNPVYLLSNKMRQEQLVYLGLGYCQLNDQAMDNLSKKLPNLVCLDLAHNNLCDLEGAIENVKMLTKIKILTLYGNPFVFLPQYFQSVVDSIVSLKYFDEQKAEDIKNRILQAQQAKIAAIQAEIKRQQDEQDAKDAEQQKILDKGKKGVKPPPTAVKKEVVEPELQRQTPQRLQTSASKFLDNEQGDLKIQFKDASTFTITIMIQTLENLDGILLDKYTYPEMEQKPELFRSRYWLGYELQDQIILTQEQMVSYDCDGRIDFEHQFDLVCKPTVEVRDFIERGFIVTIYQEQPVMIYLENEEGDKKPDMNELNLPLQERQVVGVCRIELDWLRSQNKDNCQKYRLFPDKTQLMSELIHPYDNENELIESQMEYIRGEAKKEEDLLKQIVATQEAKKDINKTKGGKEVKKKDDKKQPKKGKEIEPEKKTVQQLNWPINDRSYVYAHEKRIARSSQMLLAVRVILGV